MARYATFANGATGGSDVGIVVTDADGTTPHGVYDIIIGSDATPADQAAEYVVNRSTDVGTGGTSVTPEPLDPKSPAAAASSSHGAYSTTQPADTANSELLHIAMNQRATFRWVAAPGSHLISAVAGGIFLRSVAMTSAFNSNATMLFEE